MTGSTGHWILGENDGPPAATCRLQCQELARELERELEARAAWVQSRERRREAGAGRAQKPAEGTRKSSPEWWPEHVCEEAPQAWEKDHLKGTWGITPDAHHTRLLWCVILFIYCGILFRIFAPMITKDIWSVVLFPSCAFFWFWYQDDVCFKERCGKLFPSSIFRKSLTRNWYYFFPKFWVKITNEALYAWRFLCGKVSYHSFLISLLSLKIIFFFLNELR